MRWLLVSGGTEIMKKILTIFIIGIAGFSVFAGRNGETGSTAPTEALTWIWYPNESTPEFAESRAAVIEVASKALGREITMRGCTESSL